MDWDWDMSRGERRRTANGAKVRWIAGERSEKQIVTEIGPELNGACRRMEVDGEVVQGDLE